jgi:hypothetical protein
MRVAGRSGIAGGGRFMFVKDLEFLTRQLNDKIASKFLYFILKECKQYRFDQR